ncbi:TetR family transcriptional regulator [Kribbella pittospori]|uniref:TetR family transcriptional regulator n=1 Tax=Kribbella pittospori TaxID=722689 RepID=A0A4R0JZ68_9ACTN|nr:TetR family transcriptional regulator [Kribbella pittospori]
MSSARSLRTRARIVDVALDLFERDGYEATTTAQIAAAAGVTPMTFFRHFSTKAAVVVSDPYDPVIAEAVEAQPLSLPALERTRRGMLVALEALGALEDVTARRRVALAASHPALRAAVAEATVATEQAIVERLVRGGADKFDARIAAGACLGAATAALLALPEFGGTLAEAVSRALRQLEPYGRSVS